MEKSVFKDEKSSALSAVISLSVITEALITYFNRFFVLSNFPWQMLASIIVGVLVAFAYKIDITELVIAKPSVPYVGFVITGVLLSRGSNYVYDLLNALMH